MTRDELLRILDFSDKTRALAEKSTSLAQTDHRWNVIAYSIRRHLEGKLLTITSAASASGAPYGTAMRRISELIDEEMLLKRPRSKSGKSFSLHPTRKLIREFESYALLLKAHVGNTFGFIQGEAEMGDFFFGASYMAPKILSFPNAMRIGVGYDRTIRILCPEDPTFRTLESQSRVINELCGTTIEITCLPIDELHQTILDNHLLSESRYDLICFDLPWIGELAEKMLSGRSTASSRPRVTTPRIFIPPHGRGHDTEPNSLACRFSQPQSCFSTGPICLPKPAFRFPPQPRIFCLRPKPFMEPIPVFPASS